MDFRSIEERLDKVSEEEKTYFENELNHLPVEAKRLLFLLIVKSDEKYRVRVDDISRIQYRQLINRDVIEVEMLEDLGYLIQILPEHPILVGILKKDFMDRYNILGE